MLKKIFIIFSFLFIANCSAPGTALLGPAFTGATTKSVAQASLSFGTNQIVRKIHKASKTTRNQITIVSEKIESFAKKTQSEGLLRFHN